MEPVAILAGAVLLLVGATAATVTQRRYDAEGRSARAPLALAPLGALVGAGAALIRGWDLVAAMAAGAVVVPLVGLVGRYVEVRRARRRNDVGGRRPPIGRRATRDDVGEP